ncbi:hypothetical protein CSIM01_01645 [Colletotrichum simmondsii]|uniref:Uncharacterized protein n=1 Tax=Colletotrichum simmondsii TaxID=703756 RepID=A0A135TRI2_9PEZI|nr:hypothetical protein CSIM01_01645 [Colletotrichum simmondsii]
MAANRTYFARYPYVWHDRSTRSRLATMSLETIEESLGEVSETPTPEEVKKKVQSASTTEAITVALFEQVYAPGKPVEKEKGPSTTWTPTTPGCIDCNTSPFPSHNHNNNNIGWTSFEDITLDARTLAEYGIRSPRVKSRRTRFHYADNEQEPLTRNEPWIKRFSYFEDGIAAAREFQRRDDAVGVVDDTFHVGELPAQEEIEELVLPPPVLPLSQSQAPMVAPRQEDLRPRSLDLSAAKVDESGSESEITSEETLCPFCSSVVWSESEEDSEYSLADQEIRRELDAVNWDFEKWALGDGESDADGEEPPASPAERCGGLVAVVEMEGGEEAAEEEQEQEQSAFSVVLLANLVGFSISFLIVSIVFGLRSGSQ